MNSAPFTVMDASAGSGKTRNLVKAVLLEALSQRQTEFALRPIMAITFTNKAAAEMKSRLLEYLIDFSSKEPNETSLLAEIAEEIQIEKAEVISRAKRLLKYILHHYNDLSFGTIDAFTSRLVRTFAKDLALAENFEIVLNTDQLLAEATDQVISEAGKDEKLTQMLLDFVAQKLEDEKAWSIDSALRDMAKKLLQENHREPLSRLRDFTATDLLDIRKKLEKRRQIILNQIAEKGKNGLRLLAENSIPPEAVVGGQNGFSNFFNYLAQTRLDKCTSFTPTVQKNIDADKWHSGKATTAEKNAIDSIKNQLLEIAISGRNLAQEHAPFLVLAEEINKNMFGLATLSALDVALNHIEEAQNILPLAAFNHIVNTKVKDEPAPFIFERLGERYKHFFIDEFQDTSKLQWQNILPLIENGLAGKGSTLIVGDAKQSIYRWRNGEAEQFIDLSQRAKAGFVSAAIPAKIHPLAENWRSRKTVVEFNNALFTCVAEDLEHDGYRDLYQNAHQHPRKAKGGFVEIKLLPKKDFKNDAFEYTLTQIEGALAEGYRHKDIVLLVRRNSDGADLVKELTTRNVPVISADSLLLGNSYEGQLLAGMIALRSSPKNKTMRWAMAKSLLQLGFFPAQKEYFQVAYHLVNKTPAEVLAYLENRLPGISEVVFAATDLYTFTANLCMLLQLNGADNAFTQAFLQAIHNFVENENGSTFGFISWWQDTGKDISISAPDQIDAIKVATIHKSKGLQYPVVIVPFAKWRYYEKSREAWIHLPPEEFEGLSESLVSVSKSKSEIIGGAYAQTFEKLIAQEKFDSLNMLYVACTRAEERLYLCGVSEQDNADIFSVVKLFLAQQESHKTDDQTYRWGEKTPPEIMHEKADKPKRKTVESSGWQSKVKMAITAPPGWETEERDARIWGNRVHFVLSRIKTTKDVLPVLHQLKNEGTLDAQELENLGDIIHKIVNHPTLKSSFAVGVNVFNERDILLPNLERKRPDRIAQLPDSTVVLIDYKTGEASQKHQQQIEEYAQLLQQSGFGVIQKHIVYINTALEVVSS